MKRKKYWKRRLRRRKTQWKADNSPKVENCLVLNIWEDGNCQMRHAMNCDTGEYETYHTDSGQWRRENLNSATGNIGYWACEVSEEQYAISDGDKDIIKAHTQRTYRGNIYGLIVEKEQEYSYENGNCRHTTSKDG